MLPGQHYYYEAIRRTTIQFINIFSNINIARYDDSTGNVLKYVRVPVTFAPKSKQWYWEAKKQNKVLPMMAINMTGIEYSTDRSVNRNSKINIGETTRNGDNFYYNPVPYDFEFEVQIASKYMVDVIQLIEQILPYFQPESYVNLSLPILNIDKKNVDEGTGTEPLNIKVIYEGNSLEQTIDIPEADYRIIIWTLNFRVQGYLFKPKFTVPLVNSISFHWVFSEDELYDHLEDFKPEEVMSVTINNIINKLEDDALDIFEDETTKYVYIKDDIRENKTLPYELSEQGVTGYERSDRDLSNSLIYWNGDYWEWMGNVFNKNVQEGQVIYTKMITPIEGDIPEDIKTKMEELEDLRKLEITS